jgi:four helix bundle protein
MTSERAPTRIRSYRDLVVWQKSIDLVVETYRLAGSLPASERYVLRDQLLRASISVPANIAEGQGRLSKADYVRHLSVARGSLLELETLLHVARTVGHLREQEDGHARRLADEVGRMLWALTKRLGTRQLAPKASSRTTNRRQSTPDS